MSDLKLNIDVDIEYLTVSFDSPIVFTGDNVIVNWGDSTTPTIYTSGTLSHTYDTGGEYEITITGDIIGINDYAFQEISEIVIPSSITNIGNYVFGSGAIEKVTFEGTTPPTLGNGSLYLDAEYGFTIRVPTGSLTTYQQSEHFPNVGWNNYELYTIEEYTPESSSSSSSSDPTATLYNHIKQLNKQWFYEKSEIDQSLLTKSIAIVEKSSANSGAFKTYQITQGGVAVSGEIDIPKDFLVKSGSIKTAGATPTTAESNAGVLANEKYISLIVNTKDNETSSGNTELIIPAKGLVEDTLYYADESTITLYVDSNDGNKNKFKIKDGGVDTAQLKNGAVTSDKIASAVKNSWISSSDVENAINGALDDLAELIYPTSNQSP